MNIITIHYLTVIDFSIRYVFNQCNIYKQFELNSHMSVYTNVYCCFFLHFLVSQHKLIHNTNNNNNILNYIKICLFSFIYYFNINMIYF